MADETNDFWPKEITEIVTPVKILREQATQLGRKTNYILDGKVRTHARSQLDDFVHTLLIVVPTLDDYTYELLSVEHGVELYPVTVHFQNEREQLATEEAFVLWLQRTLSSETTKRILRNLLSQAQR